MGLDTGLLGLFTTQLLANSVYSVLAPFFPKVAREKGVSGELVGLVFSGYPIAAFVVSPLMGVLVTKIGRKRVFLTGAGLVATSMFSFGSLPLLDGPLFIVAGLFTRFLQGIGGAAIGTSSFAVIASNYCDRMEIVLGIQNSVAGVGMLVGPIIGSALYTLGGFGCIFYTYGTVFLCILPCAYYLLPADKAYEEPESKVKIHRLICNRVLPTQTIVTDGLVVVMAMLAITFLEPVLSDHLHSFDLSTATVGLLFAVPTASYAVAVVILSKLPEEIDRKVWMLTGLLTGAAAMVLVGPWSGTGLPPSLAVVSVGLVILGAAIGACVCKWYAVPVLPDMVKAAVQKLPRADPEHVSDATSGILSAYFFLGEISGPPLAGFLRDWTGFENAAACIAAAMVAYCVIFGFVASAFKALNTCRPSTWETNRNSPLLGTENEMVATKDKFFYYIEEDE